MYKISVEFESLIYNNYLALTSTAVNMGISEDSNDNNRFSIFLIFGYANGTDEDIYIYKYANDITKDDNNLVYYLTNKTSIDNNIFGYEIIKDSIKLVSIPEEILFYNKNNNNNINNNIKLENGDTLSINYTLLIKEETNININYMEYQIILSEGDYETFNSLSSQIINCSLNNNAFVDQKNFYTKKLLYGRTNTLFFATHKCHEFCFTCLDLGISDDNQKCTSCKDKYSYFHKRDFFENCVPENKFYDNEAGQLVECTDLNSKFYFDEDNQKKICFKNTKNCPDEYPYLKSNSNECFKSLTETETASDIKSDLSYDSEFITVININTTKIFLDNEKAYFYMLELLETYDSNKDGHIYVTSESNISFELTTDELEKKELINEQIRDNMSMIDLDGCETILRDSYKINETSHLILLKSENLNSIPSERNVQYEIFEPLNKTRLNLTLCEKSDINLYFQIELNSETEKLYKDLNKLGYDIFNINDPFYNDICIPYKTQNGTDIILSDRKNDIYYKNNNLTTCQDNCIYLKYISESKLLKCKCNINEDTIDYKEQKKFTSKKLYESFYEILKYSNYKIVKCYKLIFYNNPCNSNSGCIIVLILFGIYFLFLIIYIFKGINPLKINIVKSITENQKAKLSSSFIFIKKNSNKNILNGFNKNSIKAFKNKSHKNLKNLPFPPKKQFSKKIINTSKGGKSRFNQNFYSIKNLSIVDQKLYIINNSEDKSLSNNFPHNKKNIKKNNLDDFELNNLEYWEAKNLDKRSFCDIYLSLLKREHKLIFTFFIWNDYNLYYIKFMRFIFLICTDMAMNVIFFSDESMHKVYLNYGKYDFFQQVPQTIYSVAVSQVIEVFICYLSLTDKHYYAIKALKLKEYNPENFQIFKVLRCVKLKLLGFVFFTLIFFGFYWYLIVCFCAIYKNTQNIFIKDFIISFILGLLYPLILYLFPSVLRVISLRVSKSCNLACIYKLSDIIPIF